MDLFRMFQNQTGTSDHKTRFYGIPAFIVITCQNVQLTSCGFVIFLDRKVRKKPKSDDAADAGKTSMFSQTELIREK